MGFPGDLAVKNTHSNWEEIDLIPGSGRYLGERNGNAPQYSYLRNSMDKGAWWATVHEVARVGHHLATKPPPPWLEVSPLLDNSWTYISSQTSQFCHTFTETLCWHLCLRVFKNGNQILSLKPVFPVASLIHFPL